MKPAKLTITKCRCLILGEVDMRISETKVRNLVYEIELKYAIVYHFVSRLIKIMKKGHYFEYEIRRFNSVSDRIFAIHIVTISRDTFEKLLLKLFENENQVEAIICELPDI